jgi:signal transduction histidine kinase
MLVVLYLVVGSAVAYASRRWLTNTRRSSRRIQPEAALEPSGRRQGIYELISELSSSLSYQRILENALSLSTNTLVELGAPVDDLVSMVLFFADSPDNGTKLEIVTSRLLLPTDTHLMLPGVSGLIGHSIEEGLPEVSKNISSDPELSQFASLHEYKSAYCIPLRSGLEAYGVMVFSHPDSDFFSSERREVLDIIGKQFVIAIQNAQLYQNLEQEKERMMTIQEDARKQMARDLHDGPTQAIAAIALRVNFARRLMERDEKAAAEELYKIEELARRTTKEIRHMLFTLRPLVLESKGLVAALEAMAEKMKDTFDQNVIIQVNPEAAEALGSGKQAVVFYLAEEAVNNARKHAQADHIWVTLRNAREGISILEIRDDGVGFDVQAVDAAYEERGSLGMVNMRERTQLINGLVHIDSKVGGGTSVRIAIPLNEDAAEKLRRGM